MVEINLEIMGFSLARTDDIQGHNNLHFKARTISGGRRVCRNFESNNTLTIFVLQDMKSEPIPNGGAVYLFLELWSKFDELNPTNTKGGDSKSEILGLAKHNLDEQLGNANLNPSIQWLEIYDPISGKRRGKVLIKILIGDYKTPSRLNIPTSSKKFVDASTNTSGSGDILELNFHKSLPKPSAEVQVQTDNASLLYNPRPGPPIHFHSPASSDVCLSPLSPEKGRPIRRSRTNMKKSGSTAHNAKKSQPLQITKLTPSTTPTQPQSSLLKRKAPEAAESPKQPVVEDDSDSIDNVISLLKETLRSNNYPLRGTEASDRLAPDGQNASDNGQSPIKSKDSNRESSRNLVSNNASACGSSVNSSRSRRIAANIYSDFP